jgi:hypothetical protein
MVNERKRYKSSPCLLQKIDATVGISKKVDEHREAVEECISAIEQPGDTIIDDELRFLA